MNNEAKPASPQNEAHDASRANSLKASLSYSLIGQAFYLVSQLAVLSALAHFRGPLAVGEFGLALAITTPFFLLLNMGFRTTQAVDVGDEFSFRVYGGTRMSLTIFAALVSVLLAFLFANTVSTLIVVGVVTLAKIFESISNLAYGTFQKHGRMDYVAASFLLRGTITIVAFVTLLYFGADTATALLAQTGSWALIGLVIDYPRASRLSERRLVWPSFSLLESWRLIRHSAPLGGGLLANSLQMSVVRLLVEFYLGLEALGLFTAVAYFQQAGVTVSNSISNAIVNRLAVLRRKGQRSRIRRIVVRLLAIFLLVGGLGIAICYYFGDFALLVLFGETYQTAAPLLVVISIVVSLRMLSTVPQSMLFAQQRYKEFFSFQAAALCLTILLAWFMIPAYGVLGAGYVLLAVALFRLLVLEVVLMFRAPK